MQYEIRQKPNFSIARVQFEQPGEQLVAESAAMVAKDSGVEMKTEMRGGLLQAAKRKMMGGESLFQNTFTATQTGQSLWVAPPAEGDILAFELDGSTPIYMSSGNYIASGAGVNLDTKWKGGKGFFSGTSMFMLRAEGTGPLFMGSYGGIHAVDVGPEGYVVDNYHIVAFTGGLDYNVRKVGGLVSLFAGGEGLVCNFTGQGRLWVSTRSSGALARFLHPYRPVETNN
jgi:uncharacterized protein (TIGR00266 family)